MSSPTTRKIEVNSLLASDQGVRPVLGLFNDLCYVQARALKLYEWNVDQIAEDPTPQAVSFAAQSLKAQPVTVFLTQLAKALAEFDWRSASTAGLSELDRTAKLAFRGSGGYVELRKQLMALLRKTQDGSITTALQALDQAA